MFLSLRYSKMVSFVWSTTFSVREINCYVFILNFHSSKYQKQYSFWYLYHFGRPQDVIPELQLVTILFLICDSYMSRRARFVSVKLYVEFSIFDSVSFLLKFTFLFNKMHGLFDLKTSQLLSKLHLVKSHTQFCFQTSSF